MGKKYRNRIAATSKEAYSRRVHSGKQASQKQQILEVFKRGGAYSFTRCSKPLECLKKVFRESF